MGFKFAQRLLDDTRAQQNFEQLEGELDGIGGATGSFSAYLSTTTSAIPSGTPTQVPYDAEEWDTSDWFDTSTHQFTPQVAGIYRFSAAAVLSPVTNGAGVILTLRKNGAEYRRLDAEAIYTLTSQQLFRGTAPAQANGTTDYFDITIQHNAASAGIVAGQVTTRFDGELVGRT